MKLCIPWIKFKKKLTPPLNKMGDNFICKNIFIDIEDTGSHRSEVLFKEFSKDNKRGYRRSGSKELLKNQQRFKRVKKISIEEYWKKLDEYKVKPSISTVREHTLHLEIIKDFSK